MRPGVVGYGEPLEALLTAASRAGMSHLEIDLNDERNGLESLTPQRCTDVARVAESLALTLSLHAPYTLNLCDKVPALRRASVAFLRDCLGVADAFHATHITVHPGYYNGPQAHGPVRDEARARLVESVRQAAEPRRDGGTVLALETASPSRPGSMFSLLGVDTGDFNSLFGAVASPSVGMCLDIGHTNLCKGGPIEYMRRFSGRIVCVHYHDNQGNIDEHLKPGQGTVPWKLVMRGLLEIGYVGPCVSEVSRVPADEAWAALTSFSA